MAKFDNERAEFLYGSDPNDQVGSSSEGTGWAALYIMDENVAGEIIVEQIDGSVDYFTYDTEEELREAWATFEKTLELGQPEPEDLIVYELGDTMETIVLVPAEISWAGDAAAVVPTHAAKRFGSTAEALDWIYRFDVAEEGQDVWIWREGRYFLTEVGDGDTGS